MSLDLPANPPHPVPRLPTTRSLHRLATVDDNSDLGLGYESAHPWLCITEASMVAEVTWRQPD